MAKETEPTRIVLYQKGTHKRIFKYSQGILNKIKQEFATVSEVLQENTETIKVYGKDRIK